MKERLYRLITEEVYEVTCHCYVEDDDDDYCYHPRGAKTYYFTDEKAAEDFYLTYATDCIQRCGFRYISNASYPFKTTRVKYVEVTEEEARSILDESSVSI